MAIRKPTLWPSQRKDATAKELIGEAIQRASVNEDLVDIPYLRGVLSAIKDVLRTERRHSGRKLARQLAKARRAGDEEYDRGFDDGFDTCDEARNATSDGWLDKLADSSNLSKWADAHVRRLGVLEHCDEILTLHRAEAVAKAEGRKGAVEPALERELADLWCILEMHRMADPGFAKTCDDRGWRFRP